MSARVVVNRGFELGFGLDLVNLGLVLKIPFKMGELYDLQRYHIKKKRPLTVTLKHSYSSFVLPQHKFGVIR